MLTGTSLKTLSRLFGLVAIVIWSYGQGLSAKADPCSSYEDCAPWVCNQGECDKCNNAEWLCWEEGLTCDPVSHGCVASECDDFGDCGGQVCENGVCVDCGGGGPSCPLFYHCESGTCVPD